MTPTRTEQRNPRTRGLDTKSTIEILRILNREDQRVALAVRRELPQIARAVDAIVKSFRRGGQADLHRRGNQRAAGGAGRGGMSADIRHAAEDGAGVDRGRREGTAWRCGRRGGFCVEWRERFGARPRYEPRCGRGNRGERHDALCAGRRGMGQAARVRDGGGDFESAIAAGAHRQELRSLRRPGRRRLPGPRE